MSPQRAGAPPTRALLAAEEAYYASAGGRPGTGGAVRCRPGRLFLCLLSATFLGCGALPDIDRRIPRRACRLSPPPRRVAPSPPHHPSPPPPHPFFPFFFLLSFSYTQAAASLAAAAAASSPERPSTSYHPPAPADAPVVSYAFPSRGPRRVNVSQPILGTLSPERSLADLRAPAAEAGEGGTAGGRQQQQQQQRPARAATAARAAITAVVAVVVARALEPAAWAAQADPACAGFWNGLDAWSLTF